MSDTESSLLYQIFLMLKDFVCLGRIGKLFHSTAPLNPKLFFKYSVFGLESKRLMSDFQDYEYLGLIFPVA